MGSTPHPQATKAARLGHQNQYFHPLAVRILALGLVATGLVCGPSDVGKPAPQNPSNADAAAGSFDSSSTLPFTDGGLSRCGEQMVALKRGQQPEVLIVLDRSASMRERSGANGASRWDEMTAAVVETTAALQNDIKWGLVMFPQRGTECEVGSGLDSQLALGNAADIAQKIAFNAPPADPNGTANTPTAEALSTARIFLQGRPASVPRFILLATDGEPNCGPAPCTSCPSGLAPDITDPSICCDNLGGCTTCPDRTRPIDAVAFAASLGINTFVIGVNTADNEAATTVLNSMALAGKRPRTVTGPSYYPVDSKSDLVTVMSSIGSRIVSCEFPVPTAPIAPDMVEISLANERVPRDKTRKEGWDFGANNLSVSFYGSWCDRLQMSAASDLRALYKCPAVQ